MALVYVFCFWFSLRLGAILCAALCALRVTIFTSIALLKDMNDLKNGIEKFLLSIEYSKPIANFVSRDYAIVLFIIVSTYLALYVLSCVLMASGAILCKPQLCYPFICLHGVIILVDLFCYSILFKYLMNLASVSIDKRNLPTFGLTEVIVFLTLGIFYVFYDIYLEICVYCFTEAVKTLRKNVLQRTLQPVLPLNLKPGEFGKKKQQTPVLKFETAHFTKAFLRN